MHTEPGTVERPEQPYVAVRGTVTMATISTMADRIPEVFAWLAARGLDPAGPPFLRYLVIDMKHELEVEAGVPLAAPVAGDGEIRAGVLPAGRYAAVTHTGPYDGLVPTIADLRRWADDQGLAWDMTREGRVERWGCRIESYRTDPRQEPDPAAWETDVFFRLG